MAAKINQINAIEPIGSASEGLGSYVYKKEIEVGDSMYGGELNAIYITANKNYYKVNIFVPNPIYGAVPINNVYKVLF